MFHSGSGNETEVDRFADRQLASKDKRQKEDGKGVKDCLAGGGNSSLRTEKAPGDTKEAENDFLGNNKPEPPSSDAISDNKSDVAVGAKNVGAHLKGKGDGETERPQAVTRKPSQMDVIFNTSAANQDEKGTAEAEGSSEDLLLTATTERAMSSGEFSRRRPPTRSGGRNLLDSTFSLSGAQIDDDKKSRPTIRVQNPPGGRSSGIWYS